MPVEIELISGGIGLLLRASGKLTTEQLTVAGGPFLATAQNLDRVEFAVVDGSLVDSATFSVKEIRALAESAVRIGRVLRPGLRVALVFPRDEAFALARMWEICAERTGWETQVFHSLTDAAMWLDRHPRQIG